MVQVGHVCMQAGAAYDVPCGCHLVLLAVADQQALLQTMDYCRQHAIRFVTFIEPDPIDDTSPEPMGLTALCTEPVSADKRKLFRRYRLWEIEPQRHRGITE